MNSSPKSTKEKVLLKLDDGQLYVYAKAIALCSAKMFKAGLKEITIETVSKSNAELFFGSFSSSLPTDCTQLCTLIALTSKFNSPTMRDKISKTLQKESFFTAVSSQPQVIKDLLQTSDEYYSESGFKDVILQDCIRLTGCLTSQQLGELVPKLEESTQFAVHKLARKVQRAMAKKKKEQEPPLHKCDGGHHLAPPPPRHQMADSGEESDDSIGYHHPETWDARLDDVPFTHQSRGKWRCEECGSKIDVEEPQLEHQDLTPITITKGMFRK